MTAAVPTSRDRQGSSNTVLLLSLMLILLAFFILLNSLSEFEAGRAHAVIESVNRAFNGKIESGDRTPAHSASLGALPEAEAKMREVASLFEAIVPAARAKRIRRAKAVRVELPAASLFRPAGVGLRPGSEILIQRLARLLARGGRGGPSYDLEVLLGLGAPPAGGAGPVTPGPGSLEVRRAALLAQRLIEEGLPPPGLSIGLLPGQPGMLRFVVRVHRDRLRRDSATSGRRAPGAE